MTDQPRPARRPDGAALITALALAGFGAVILWDAARLPADAGYSGVGPADVPRLVGACLIGLGVWTGLAGLRGRAEPAPRQKVAPILWIIGGLGAQLALLGFTGFSIATAVLFACTARAFGYRRLLVALPIGLVACLVIFWLFDRVLSLNLPTGVLETAIFGG